MFCFIFWCILLKCDVKVDFDTNDFLHCSHFWWKIFKFPILPPRFCMWFWSSVFSKVRLLFKSVSCFRKYFSKKIKSSTFVVKIKCDSCQLARDNAKTKTWVHFTLSPDLYNKCEILYFAFKYSVFACSHIWNLQTC